MIEEIRAALKHLPATFSGGIDHFALFLAAGQQAAHSPVLMRLMESVLIAGLTAGLTAITTLRVVENDVRHLTNQLHELRTTHSECGNEIRQLERRFYEYQLQKQDRGPDRDTIARPGS